MSEKGLQKENKLWKFNEGNHGKKQNNKKRNFVRMEIYEKDSPYQEYGYYCQVCNVDFEDSQIPSTLVNLDCNDEPCCLECLCQTCLNKNFYKDEQSYFIDFENKTYCSTCKIINSKK